MGRSRATTSRLIRLCFASKSGCSAPPVMQAVTRSAPRNCWTGASHCRAATSTASEGASARSMRGTIGQRGWGSSGREVGASGRAVGTRRNPAARRHRPEW